MDGRDYRRIVLRHITNILHPLGFIRKSNTFVRRFENITQFVNLQSSSTSTATALKVTVNIAVYSEDINQFFDPGDDIGCRDWVDNHWQERIGSVCKPPSDIWWAITSENEAHKYGYEISELLLSSAVPEINRYSSLPVLLRYLASNGSGGYLSAGAIKMLEEMEHSVDYPSKT